MADILDMCGPINEGNYYKLRKSEKLLNGNYLEYESY